MRDVILKILMQHQIIFRGNREFVAMEIEKALKEWSLDLKNNDNDKTGGNN